MRRDEPSCRYCGIELRYDVPLGHPDRGCVDHVIPLAQAPHLALVRSNLAGCCHRCNTAKGNRTPEQWRAHEQDRRYVSVPRLSALAFDTPDG